MSQPRKRVKQRLTRQNAVCTIDYGSGTTNQPQRSAKMHLREAITTIEDTGNLSILAQLNVDGTIAFGTLSDQDIAKICTIGQSLANGKLVVVVPMAKAEALGGVQFNDNTVVVTVAMADFAALEKSLNSNPSVQSYTVYSKPVTAFVHVAGDFGNVVAFGEAAAMQRLQEEAVQATKKAVPGALTDLMYRVVDIDYTQFAALGSGRVVL